MHSTSARRQSFIAVAADSHFPLQNLPFGIFQTPERSPRMGVAIGDQVVDLAVLAAHGLLGGLGADIFLRPSLNAFIAQGRAVWRQTRQDLTHLLDADTATLRDDAQLRAEALVPMAQARMLLPVEIGGYIDFYSSREHATNVGKLFRDPANALLPNWLHIPIGYNGRASSVVVSGTPIRRPNGQTKAAGADTPQFGPCQRLDFELETAFIIGQPNDLAEPVPVDQAEDHIFGLVLMNDWSARDIQQWEYVPLGPFNGKSFGTTISPWVVTMEALEPFRVTAPKQDPQPLAYLRQAQDGAFSIDLEVGLRTASGHEALITRTNARHLYWTMAQQLAHHTASGANTRVGDLMGSGTISGPSPQEFGSLLELTLNGKQPVDLGAGQTRAFIEDGDEIRMTGWCQGDGYRVGFGPCTGRVLPAHPLD